MRSSDEQIAARLADLEAVAKHYTDFRDFYYDCSVELLGFIPTDMQLDIANYVARGGQYIMVQAQRGEAKTTITGCYAVWCLIHDPRTRVLILSAGTPMAEQISTWCIQIINGMDVLECIRPDKSHPGVRTSVKKFDIHHDLKGAMASPSIACLGITSNMQGYRADVLIPDDIESSKNSRTQAMRDILRNQTREFTAINQHGRIVYLGTPQSVDSIYNELPARGFDVRIWPGRFPNLQEIKNYGTHLAPFIKNRLKKDPTLMEGGGPTGERGQPTDSGMMSEETLTLKEIDQGKPYFNLQFMLDTALSDADRYPLKLKDLMFYSFDFEDAPARYTWTNDVQNIIDHTVGSPLRDKIFRPARTSDEFLPYSYRLASIDPSGGGANGDETGIAVLFAVNGYICVMHVAGIPGGTDPGKLNQIVEILRKWGVHEVIVEKNYGNGAYAIALKAALAEAQYTASVEDVWSQGQKEKRIIDGMEPVVGAHKLVINTAVLHEDVESTMRYPTESRSVYQFLFQLKYITLDRGSLIHDDRLEAVSQGVNHLNRVILDHNKTPMQTVTDRFKSFRKDKGGMWRFAHRVQQQQQSGAISVNVMDRFRK